MRLACLLLLWCGSVAATSYTSVRIDEEFEWASLIVDVTITEAKALQWWDPETGTDRLCGIVYKATLNSVLKGSIRGSITFGAVRAADVGSRQILSLHPSNGGLRPYLGWEPLPSQVAPFDACSAQMPQLKNSSPHFAQFASDDLLRLSGRLHPSSDIPSQTIAGTRYVKWNDLQAWFRKQKWYTGR